LADMRAKQAKDRLKINSLYTHIVLEKLLGV
jgi:hypothetical protein